MPQIINTSFFFDTTTGLLGSGATYGAPNSRPEPINIYRTTDGGASWTTAVVPQGYRGSVSQIFMVDRSNGWASILPWSSGNSHRLWKTTDGGQSWNEMPTTGTATCIYQTSRALIITDLDPGVEGGISTDGGMTFSSIFPGGTNCIGFLNDTDGIVTVFRGGPWERTTDGGLTWTSLPTDRESWGIAPVRGTSTYYCAGEWAQTPVIKSTDKGLTWSPTLHLFNFETSGDIHVVDSETLYVQVNSNIAPNLYTGVLRSTDGGINWTNLGGPQNFNDSRFTVIPITCGAVIFAFDTGGAAFKLVDIFKHAATGLDLSTKYSVTALSCEPEDTTIITGILGCLPSTARLDSLWLTGSLAFTLGVGGALPRTLGTVDSIPIGYSASSVGADTAELHLRYDLGSGARDTTVLLTGRPSAFASNRQFLHREVAVAYYGQYDSLPMALDISSNINLDSLWPFVTNMQGTFAFDSSVAQFQSYLAPSGWSLVSLTDRGDSVEFGIHKNSGGATHPLALGTAVFSSNTKLLATTWVTLPRFVMEIGGQALSLCISQNEDNHWTVKVLGVLSGVRERGSSASDLTVYPNPALEQLFLRNPLAHSVDVTIYDALGRAVASTEVPAQSTSMVSLASLPRGMYIVREHSGTCTIISHE